MGARAPSPPSRHGGACLSHLDRITTDPQVCHGKPVVRDLRIPAETVLELMDGGMTSAELLADFPDLEPEDLLAVAEYGSLRPGTS